MRGDQQVVEFPITTCRTVNFHLHMSPLAELIFPTLAELIPPVLYNLSLIKQGPQQGTKHGDPGSTDELFLGFDFGPR